ncbi:MAG TPA: hypothetical protein VM120_17895 [Bryobacteraceae bacterium]|nr:hypothetical protein [Bryobacteraceae bacterium]
MKRSICWVSLFAMAQLPAQEVASASRGAQLLATHRCQSCHHFEQLARPTGLARLMKTQLTPARLVGAVWNHAPAMWSAIEDTGTPPPATFGERDAHDLLVWFAAAGYFEPPGDARDGSRVFQSKGCASCHAARGNSEAPAVAAWKSVTDPLQLFRAMWNHAPVMKAALDSRRMSWPSLSVNETRDIAAYAGSLANPQANRVALRIGDPDKGRAALQAKACQNCHREPPALPTAAREHTLTEFAAILWNHAAMMTTPPPPLSDDELSGLLAYLWTSRYFERPGNAKRGKAVFASKRCGSCHSIFPEGKPYDAARMLAILWKHTPAVLHDARRKGIPWPAFRDSEMADLIAYANQVRQSPLVK